MGDNLPASKNSGMAIPNPNISDWENCTASYDFKKRLISVLQVREEFNPGDHSLLLHAVRGEIRRRNLHNAQADLEGGMAAALAL